MTDAVIYDAVRVPRGKGEPGGALYEVKPLDLMAGALSALVERNGLDPARVDSLLLGCAHPVGDQGFNVARASVLRAGWASGIHAAQLNSFEASGLEALLLTAARIRSNWAGLAVAGGLESPSRISGGAGGGPLRNDPELINLANLLPPGVAADLLATAEGISRKDLDDYVSRSVAAAGQAHANDHFQRSLCPVYDQNGLLLLDRDEWSAPETTSENDPPCFAEQGQAGFDQMALLRFPQLETIGHEHTRRHVSVPADGAAAVLIGRPGSNAGSNLQARARILAGGYSGPTTGCPVAGIVPAAQNALHAAGMQPGDIDLWEIHEDFAVTPIHCERRLQLEPERVNVNGGCLAFGVPAGAIGSILVSKLLDELEFRNRQTGMVLLGARTGLGIAAIIERI